MRGVAEDYRGKKAEIVGGAPTKQRDNSLLLLCRFLTTGITIRVRSLGVRRVIFCTSGGLSATVPLLYSLVASQSRLK